MKLKLLLTITVLLFRTLSIAQTAPFEIEIIKKQGKVLTPSYRNLKLETKGSKITIEFKTVEGKNEKFKLKASQTLANGKYLKHSLSGDQLNILSITNVKGDYIHRHIRIDLRNQTISEEKIIKRLNTKHANYNIETFSIKENHIFIHASPNRAGEEEQIMILDEKFTIQHDLQINFYDKFKSTLQNEISNYEEIIETPPSYYTDGSYGEQVLNSVKDKIEKLEKIVDEMTEGKIYPTDFITFVITPFDYNANYITFDLGYRMKSNLPYYLRRLEIYSRVNINDRNILNTTTKKSFSIKEKAHLTKDTEAYSLELFEDMILFKTIGVNGVDKFNNHAYVIAQEVEFTLESDTSIRHIDTSKFTIDEYVLLNFDRTNDLNFISSSVVSKFNPSKYDSTRTENGWRYHYSSEQKVRMDKRYLSITLENYELESTVTKIIPLPVLKDELYYSIYQRTSDMFDIRNQYVLAPSLTNNYLHLIDGNYLYVVIPRIRVKYNNEHQPKIEYFGYDVFCIDARTGEYSSTKFFYPKHSGVYSSANLSKNEQGEIILAHPKVEMIYVIHQK